jgi:hypothetical protein
MRKELLSALLLTVVVCTGAAQAAPKVVVVVRPETHVQRFLTERPGVIPLDLFFAEERPAVTIELSLMPLRIGASEGERVLLSTPEWWSLLTWKVHDEVRGDDIAYHAEDVSVDRFGVEREGSRLDVNALSDDEMLSLEGHLPVLPVGNYKLSVELRVPQTESQEGFTVTSEYRRFAVRRGDEDPDTRGTYLRWRADRILATPASDRFAQFRSVMLELAGLASNDPTPYAQLGDASIGLVSAVETAQYYEKALRIARQNVERKFGPQAGWTDETRQGWATISKSLTAFSRAIRAYPMPGIQLRVENRGFHKEIIVYRAGKAIARVE